MLKIKLTKGELKRQRDSLRQFLRYLPTLQLKKQQLQIEILHWHSVKQEKMKALNARKLLAVSWAGLLAEKIGIDLKPFLIPSEIISGVKNVAGVELPVFEKLCSRRPNTTYFW